MGLILDSTVLIPAERRGETVREIALRTKAIHGDTPTAISTISVIELTHGIHRARTIADPDRRQNFMDELCRDMIIHPVSLEIAQLAGQIEGEQAAKGVVIPFEDLVIGATALHFGFDVATHNAKHFQLIPNLRIVTP